MLCYCSICRKLSGSGGYGINLGGKNDTLKIVQGKHLIKTYHPRIWQQTLPPNDPILVLGSSEQKAYEESPGTRSFCGICGTPLWNYDERWPDLIHPYASVIDTPLPIPPNRYHILQNSKANWVVPNVQPDDRIFDEYPDTSLANWHAKHWKP